MERIMLLEDDISLVDGLEYALVKEGFEVQVVRTVKEAFDTYREGAFDLLLLDLTLPDGTGFQVCRRVRETSTVPIIFLTASDEEVNVVMGLDMGGDDYITKPFKLNELMARIQALLRRAKAFQKNRQDTSLCSGGITVELLYGKAIKDDKELELTSMEYKLLCMFMQNENILLTREIILDKLWDGNGEFVDDNTLSVYVKRLRAKIEEDASEPKLLHTVRGMGYQWKWKKKTGENI